MQGKFLISFHTLLYILLITHRKVRKIIGDNQRISEKFGEFQRILEKIGEFQGIFEENARKIGEFSRNPFLEVAEPQGDPAVVFGRFQSFLVVFPVISGYDSE